jgi:solute carrier family 25 phosphate transporter 3
LRLFGCTSFAGGAACSATHCLTLPLDVVKTKMQIEGGSMLAGATAVLRDAPGKGLLRLGAFFKGLGPTAVGYSFQGATKFGIYELLKQNGLARLQKATTEELKPKWQEFTERLSVLASSAFLAEAAATTVLAPLEVLKLRMQMDTTARARGAVRSFFDICQKEGPRALYKGLQPLAMRQLPYTVFKLLTYECVSQMANFVVGDNRHLKPFVPIFAGLFAGAVAAIVSNPADLLLTRLCGGSTDLAVAECVIAESFFEQVGYLRSLGPEIFSGLAPRLVQISGMTSIQFAVYESIRSGLGLSTIVQKPTSPPLE